MNSLKTKTLLVAPLLFWAFTFAHAQVFTTVHPDSVKPSDPAWETRFRGRLDEMVDAINITSCGNGSAGVDDGKNLWPRLFSRLYKVRNNPTEVNNLIATCGSSLLNAQWSGTMCGPFSGPGLSKYYFQYKDILPQAQKERIRNYLNQPGNYPYRCPNGRLGWHFFMRPDQQMDPVYNTENPETNPNNRFNGSEKNSENYHWMTRMPGYLFAEEFSDTTVAADVERLAYFRTFAKNWIRALYNVGRIEWNSNNYWGHTVQPLLAFYDHAKDPEVKKMAKAGLDWLLVEAALHYVDGFMAGTDVRAKDGAYRPFAGSVWGYNYFYFADNNYLPSYYSPGVFVGKSLNDFIGYAQLSGYRPPQVVVDIAQRKFRLPVEIQSAKPFYAFDHESYKDWRGNTNRSRRFEFETLWIDKDYLLSSCATNIPDGWAECDRQRPFAEQSLWRLAVKGTNNGAIQLYGNSGAIPFHWKRHVMREPREQIGQFRNAMMRILKNPDSMWIEMPRTLAVETQGNKLFVDFGNEVYAAFQPFGAIGLDTVRVPQDLLQIRYRWKFNSGTPLGALALETGTSSTFSSFADFKTQMGIRASLVLEDTNTISYLGANGNTLKMEYQVASRPFVMMTPIVPACTLTTVGTLPKVWGNTNYIDFENWHSYQTSFGQEIVYQPWGRGFMDLRSLNQGLKIKIDSSNAAVTYQTFDPQVYVTGQEETQSVAKSTFSLAPNPAKGEVKVWAQEEIISFAILDLAGRRIDVKPFIEDNSNQKSLSVDIRHLSPGIYQVVVQTKWGQTAKRLVVE